MNLSTLSNAELLARLDALGVEGNHLLATTVVYLGEVEERRLHLEAACPSMFDFCVRRLRMSESAAYRRIVAARLVRRFPRVLDRISRGEVHLSTLVMVRNIVDEKNIDSVLDAIAGKSKREVEEVIARYAPKPDVPALVRKLPVSSASQTPPVIQALSCAEKTKAVDAPSEDHAAPVPSVDVRYKVQLTASSDFRDKLERATDLMRHRNPSGDMAIVLDRALDALLEKLEKERLAMAKRATKSKGAARPGTISRPVRREVFARDGAQCTFVDEAGHRCPSRAFLELDHIEPRARGGPDDASNLRVRCRAHNRLHAEKVFGKRLVQNRIRERTRVASAGERRAREGDTAYP